MTSMYFRFKDNVDIDKHRLIELFFKDWVDNTCNREVHYTIYGTEIYGYDAFRVDFTQPTDATALTLRGVPSEFREYLEIVI